MAVTVEARALVAGGSLSSAIGLDRLLNAWMRQDPATAQVPLAIGVLFTLGGVLMVGAAAVLAPTAAGFG
jgi:hypothetical protein